MKKRIVWESKHIEFNLPTNNFQRSEPKEFDINNEIDDDEMTTVKEFFNQAPTITLTPFGPYKIDDSMHPFKDFKFWMGHTNFKLTEEMFDILDEDIVGIEVLMPVSPLRFLVGIGKLFEVKDVMCEIEEKLCGTSIDDKINSIKNKVIEEKVKEIIKEIEPICKKYAVYILPNATIEYITDQDNEFEKRLELYKKSKQVAGGILIEGK